MNDDDKSKAYPCMIYFIYADQFSGMWFDLGKKKNCWPLYVIPACQKQCSPQQLLGSLISSPFTVTPKCWWEEASNHILHSCGQKYAMRTRQNVAWAQYAEVWQGRHGKAAIKWQGEFLTFAHSLSWAHNTAEDKCDKGLGRISSSPFNVLIFPYGVGKHFLICKPPIESQRKLLCTLAKHFCCAHTFPSFFFFLVTYIDGKNGEKMMKSHPWTLLPWP